MFYAAVQRAVVVVCVESCTYLSLPQWYTEAPKHNLSRSCRFGFLNSSLFLVCLHLSGEDTSTWCYHGNSLSCISCLQRGKQDLCVLILPVRVNSITSCESYNPRKYELRPYNCYFKLHNSYVWLASSPGPTQKSGKVTLANFLVCAESAHYVTITCLTWSRGSQLLLTMALQSR